MWMGGGWHWFGNWWPILFLVLFVPAVIMLVKNMKGLPWFPRKKIIPWFVTLITLTLTVVLLVDSPELFTSRMYSVEPVNLMFPLRNGTYHIVHGGSSASMNHHYQVKAQKFALDIVKVNSWGIRASGLMPVDLSSYEIFGDKVVAPCTGEVISVENNLTDNVPPNMDPDNFIGNNAILYCDGDSILLAHLKKDSLVVKVGDQVEKGACLGEVGNTGNTTEPHLHIHAVKGKFIKVIEIAITAEGVPILFDNKFLIRNDQVTYLGGTC